VLIHFVIILLLSSVLLNILGSENMPLLLYQKSIIASFLIYSLFSIGIILENKKWSLFVELIRLLLFPVVLFYISQISTQVPFYMTYVFGAVSLFSMLFLILNRKKE
jgi:hypothetical protein